MDIAKLKFPSVGLPYLPALAMAAGIGSFSASDVIYFKQAGLDLTQIGIMIFCFNIAVTIAELHSALLFDRHSAKVTLYIGFIIRISAFVLFALNWGFSYFLAAQILAGIATAAGSGGATALVLNEVKEQNPRNMSAARSRLTLFSGLGSLPGAGLGLSLFQYFPPGIWWLACVFFIIAVLLVHCFQDRPAESYGMPLRKLIYNWPEIFKHSWTYLLIICNISALSRFAYRLIACAFDPLMLWQLKFQHISAIFVIAGFYIITLASAGAAKLFPMLKLSSASLKYSIALNIISVFCFAFANSAWAMALAFAFCVIAHMILSIQLEGLFHAAVKNSIRASAGSIISLADSAPIAIFAPIIGFLVDRFGINAAIALSALLYLSLFMAAAIPKQCSA